jgi:ABC-type lipoprotein export system ATPase subunit
MDLLDQIHGDGATIVLVTHDRDLANRAGRKIELLDGRVVTDGLVHSQIVPSEATFKGVVPASAHA